MRTVRFRPDQAVRVGTAYVRNESRPDIQTDPPPCAGGEVRSAGLAPPDSRGHRDVSASRSAASRTRCLALPEGVRRALRGWNLVHLLRRSVRDALAQESSTRSKRRGPRSTRSRGVAACVGLAEWLWEERTLLLAPRLPCAPWSPAFSPGKKPLRDCATHRRPRAPRTRSNRTSACVSSDASQFRRVAASNATGVPTPIRGAEGRQTVSTWLAAASRTTRHEINA
jgi:hypothetical protein